MHVEGGPVSKATESFFLAKSVIFGTSLRILASASFREASPAFVYICQDEGPNFPEISQIYTSAKFAQLGLSRRPTVYKAVSLTAELRA